MITIIDALKNMEGKQVSISTEHKLFGNQNISMVFEPETEIGLGFHCKNQVIYIDKEDARFYDITKDEICIEGELMRIVIKLIKN